MFFVMLRIGIPGENYHRNYINSQVKRSNNLEVAKYVHPSAAVKNAFKSRLGGAWNWNYSRRECI